MDNDVDVLCLTETWLLTSGDEAKCSDLSPLATGLSASLVLHVAVASPSLSPIRSLPVTADFSFPRSSFELSQLTFSLPQRSLHIFCLYHRPPNRKNNSRTRSLWNSFRISLSTTPREAVPGDFTFHYDVPANTYTSRLIDLLDSFNLSGSHHSHSPTGHIVDWVIDRKDDDMLLSTSTSPTLQSHHLSVLTQLNEKNPHHQKHFFSSKSSCLP